MELFNKFRETIFLKEDSNLEKQINELKKLPFASTNNEIIKDIKLLEIGLQGENAIVFELKHANIDMVVLHDITLKHENLKSQIDYIIITRGFIYLIECKNLIGNITVDNKGEFRREYVVNGKKYKEAIYSPYTQVMRHKELIKKKWMAKNNKLSVKLFEKHFDNLWYKPLVVLTNPKSILNVKFAPKYIKNNIIRVDQLVNYIKEDLKNYDKNYFFRKKTMLELGNNILENNVDEYYSFANKYNSIEENLKRFRNEKSKRMKIPAYYIFTNDELKQIIDKSPKNIEELKNLNILSEIKIKCHGEEIINILNEK